MKSIIPLLAIPILAAFALVGCNQNSPSNSTDTQSTNSPMSDASGTISGTTNMPGTNSLPDMNTNMPAINSVNTVPGMNTNMPASTNQ
jgi:hypothetical protein